MNIKLSSFTILLFFFLSINVFGQAPYQAGEAVEILWSGTWYNGKVLEVKDGTYKITYAGYSSSWDEWVEPKRLRRSTASSAVGSADPVVQTADRSNTTAVVFKKGDRVEVSYAGDWHRATIINGPDGTGPEARYEVRKDGSSYSDTYLAQWVRPLYRSNENQSFTIGNKVLFRRWDGNEYEAEVVGKDGMKYNLAYKRDGVKNTEWVPEIGVRESPNNNNNSVAKTFTGQKYKVGDRVLYHNGSFLTEPSYGTIISVDAEKRLYTIKDEKDASSRYTYPCYGVLAPGETPDNSYFIGKWQVSISGATSTFVKNGDRFRRFSGGMKLKTLDINADGTYTWQTDKAPIRGRWTNRGDVPGITILKGLDGLDWTVYQSTEAMAAQEATRDEIRFHHLPSKTGYYMAYRIGANKSCVLAGRNF